MSLFNLIWIAFFFYYGYVLTFPGIEGVDFGRWDEFIGILLLITAVLGFYFVIKTALKKVTGMSGRMRSRTRQRRNERRAMAAARSAAAQEPEGFYEDFRSDMVASEEESGEPEPEPELPVEDAPETAGDPYEDESINESLERLRKEYSLDKF